MALEEEGLKDFELGLIASFVQEANQRLKHRLIAESDRNPKKVVIFTTSASGGCEAVARTMKTFLEQSHIEAEIIDTEEVANKHDPLKLASGVTTDSIYHKVVQQENRMLEGFRQQKIGDIVARYIPSRQGAEIKKRIKQIKPAFLFSTCQYRSHEIAFAYSTGLPLRMIHCDFGVESEDVRRLFGKVHGGLVKWWFPSLETYVFESFFQHHKITASAEHGSLALIAAVTKVPLETIQGQFEAFGYPVSSSIFRIENEAELTRLKQKWDVEHDEHVIVVEMGKYGVSVLEDIFNRILESSPQKFKIKYVFVCGKNEALREKLASRVSLQKTALKRCVIYGHLNLDEMNEIRNLATLGGTKLGGATTAEYIKLRKPLLVLFFHPWELGNKTLLQRLGLCYEDDKSLPLNQIIEHCIEKIVSFSPIDSSETTNWQKVLLDTLTKSY